MSVFRSLWWRGKTTKRREECPTGIKVLQDPKDPAVDIVFVHGLNGHRENTWRYEGAAASWPEALLSQDITNARIMTFGYDATVVNWDEFLGKVSSNRIKQHAQNLLETLASYRFDDKSRERAIIFVCHSLGGIVCKDALVRSHEWATESHLVVLCRSTRGIIFLGTPHKGAELAAWAGRLARVVGLVKQTNTAILDQLRKESEELDRIQESFDIHLRSRSVNQLPLIEVKCFFEEKPITAIGPVVDYKSATLAGNLPIGINKDHREMTKFENTNDNGYRLIKSTLQRWIENLARQAPPSMIFSPTPNTSPSRFNLSRSPLGTETPVAPSPSIEERSSSSSSTSRSSFVKIPPGGKFIINEKMVKLPFHFIPSRLTGRESKYFQPREKELEEIRSTMFPPKEAPDDIKSLNHRSFLVTGLGGVGKTELALKFVTQDRDQFDAVFFLIADSETRLSEQYSTIAWDLGLIESSDKNNQELCSETFRAWLGDPVKGAPETQEVKTSVKWLLVFDNAESAEVIDKFWPAGRHGSILLTTRNPLLTPSLLSITGGLQLKGFSIDDGAHLLRICARDDRINSSSTDEDAKAIVEWIQGLPMAINQLGWTIYTKHMSISQFRQLYPTKADLYHHLSTDHTRDGSLVTAWALNGLQEQQKETFELLCLIAMLDPERIEHRTVRPRQTDLNTDGSPMTIREYIEFRAQLADTSLIDIDRESGEIRVHRVVQEVTKDMMVHSGIAAPVFNRAVNRVGDQWPFLNRNYVTGSATKVGRWEECRVTYPHILHLMVVYAELTELKVKGLASLGLAELLLEAVQYRVECGLSHDAITLLEVVERIYNQGNAGSAALVEERGKLYRGRIGLAVSSKNPDDLFHYAQLAWTLETTRHRNMGHATSILAVAHNDMATAWACHGKWEKAIVELKESTRIREGLPGFTKDKLFSPLYHLGLVYSHQGKYNDAEDVLSETIAIWEEVFGPKDAVSLRSAALFYARGNVKFSRANSSLDDIRGSLLDHREAVMRASRSAGPKNRTTLICQYQVARVSAKLGAHKIACDLLDEILSNTLDKEPYQRDIARTAFLYAQCLIALGRLTESDDWLLKSLRVYNKLRPRHARTTETLAEEDIANLIPYDFL